jgi:predicted metal-dependent hydrolase
VAGAPDGPAAVGAAVRRGRRLFNRGRYLTANQLWEEAWRAAPPDDRGFLEGLVQLAAGLHLRTRRGGPRGAVHLVSQALATLEGYGATPHDVDVARLLVEFGAYVEWIKTLGRPHRFVDRWRVPRIHGR